MRAISMQQPWAQLIADRRRHVIIKNWSAEPGERFALHANHIRNAEKCKDFGYYEEDDTPNNAILAVVEVKRCFLRVLARPSKFDSPRKQGEAKKQYAIAVRVTEKLRKPIKAKAPVPAQP